MISIIESGVTFCEFHADNVYQIENSTYISNLDKVKISEFIIMYQGSTGTSQLWVIEAKSSIPRERDEFYAEIKSKLLNSLTLLIAGCLKRHMPIYEELSENFKNLDWAAVDIKLFLVIPTVPDHQIAPMTDQFRKNFVTEYNIWNFPSHSIFVLNEEKAKKIGLIQ